MSWSFKKINEIGNVVTGKTPSTKIANFWNGEYMFVTPSDLDYRQYYCRDTERYVSEEARDRMRNQFIPVNSVMFTSIGNTIGKCAISAGDCLTNQQINSIIANEQNDFKFIYYLLCNNVERFKNLGGGSATPIVNKTTFEHIKFKVPNKSMQRRISSILSAYDDLIENNLRRIKLLEESARLLYKEWFVYLRFPGYEHTRIIDGVPEGWERKRVPEIIEINPKVSIKNEAEILYVPMASLSETSMIVSFDNMEYRAKATGAKFRNNDILFPRITPCLENGKTAYVNFLDDGEIACGSTEFIVLRGKDVSGEFVYLLARTHAFRENAIKSMVGSSGRQRVQESCFEKFPVLKPPHLIMKAFDDMVSPIFKLIGMLQLKNRKLRKARDILLPKLMGGVLKI